MKLRTQLIFAFGIVASIPMVGGGVELYAHRDASARANTALDVGRATRDGVDAARRAQFHFKLQLQEWNNILLHGHDKTLYDKHLSDFALAEQSVQRALAASATIAPELGLDVAEIQALLRMHEAVGKNTAKRCANFQPPTRRVP